MAGTLIGRIFWSLSRNDEGHRTYTVRHRVRTLQTDGPRVAFSTLGLPNIGDTWSFGNDSDPWAFCRPEMRVTVEQNTDINPSSGDGGGPYTYWIVEQMFSSRAIGGGGGGPASCADTTLDNPLLQPARIRWGGRNERKLQERDKDGNAIVNSAFEQVKGPEVEFDVNRPQISIEQNRAVLDNALLFVNFVNDATLWDYASRTVKLDNVSYERRVFGTCTFYFVRTLEFSVGVFDTFPIDEGTKVLNGKWPEAGGDWELVDIGGSPPDPTKPNHFIRAKDLNDENFHTLLGGAADPGVPLPEAAGGVARVIPLADPDGVKYYPEFNFVSLGIPTDLAAPT